MAMHDNSDKKIPFQWSAWINKNKHKMSHPQNFEILFAEKILSQVTLLDPEDVKPQFIFRDRKNRQRRIDFLIDNPLKGLSIAVEVDGYRKDPNDVRGMSSTEHDDFLARQNSLVTNIDCKLLRYSNNQWRYYPDGVIEEINELIEKQMNNFSQEEKRKRNEKYKEDAIEELKCNINIIKTSIDNSRKLEEKNNRKKLNYPTIVSILITILIIFYFAFYLKKYLSGAAVKTENHETITVAQASHPDKSKTPSEVSINSYDASSRIGEEAIVCGQVVQIKELSKMTILNFEKRYPDSPFSIVIPHRDLWQFSDPASWVDTKLCVKGKISAYKDKAELTLDTPSQLIR